MTLPRLRAATFATLTLALTLLLPDRASAAQLPAYQLDATLDPAARTLAVDGTLTLPDSLAGKSVEFLLAAPLEIESSEPAATRVPAS